MAHKSLAGASRPKLIDMKLSAREKKDALPSPMSAYKGPDYPYELRITLDEDALKRLRIDPSKLKVGDKLEVVGVSEVHAISQNRHASIHGDGKTRENQRLELQMTRINVCMPGDSVFDGKKY